jgi:DNA repair protein RadC
MSTLSCIVADSASASASESLSVSRIAQHEDGIIEQAIALLERRVFKAGPVLGDPAAVYGYLRLKLAAEPGEVFAVIYLDSRLRALAYEPLFKGSVDQTSVYPRVVVQRALATNASALILAHSHPSGVTAPSDADRAITLRLRDVLALIDVRVLDHLIIGQGKPFSFSEAGLL